MDLLFNNPIANMYGPTFLLFYGSIIGLTLFGCWVGIRLLDHTGSLPALLVPSKPDPYEIAYLRGGEIEVIRVTIFELIQRGYLQRIEDSDQIQRTLDHPNVQSLPPIARQLFDGFSSPSETQKILQGEVPPQLKESCRFYEQRLHSEQLLTSPEIRGGVRLIGLLGALIIVGLGGYKLLVALANGRFNVGFLVIMGIVALIVLLLICQTPRLSQRGKTYLKQLSLAFDGLKQPMPTLAVNTPEVNPNLALAIGLFGVGVLAGTPYDYYQQMFRRSTATGGGSSWDSSYDGGSSCSGSGCGSGCGGCGGGG